MMRKLEEKKAELIEEISALEYDLERARIKLEVIDELICEEKENADESVEHVETVDYAETL